MAGPLPAPRVWTYRDLADAEARAHVEGLRDYFPEPPLELPPLKGFTQTVVGDYHYSHPRIVDDRP